METAARLLRRSDWNIQQIITQVGYENTSYFYRLFHERYGQSPREYRQSRAARTRPPACPLSTLRKKTSRVGGTSFDVLRWKNDAECVTIKARPEKMRECAAAHGKRRWKRNVSWSTAL